MLKLLSNRFSNLGLTSSRSISSTSTKKLAKSAIESESGAKSTDNGSNTTTTTTTMPKKLILTEDLPPIPPNRGFPGDENVKNLFEMKRIRKSFRYGAPPHLVRALNPGAMVIRLLPITHCRNRHFFRIAVTRNNYDKSDGFIEDIGSIDPLPNKDNKIMVAINIERLKYYLGKQVPIKGVVGQLLGLSGFFPPHPKSYLKAYRNRLTLEKQEAERKKALEEIEKSAAATAAAAKNTSTSSSTASA